MLGSAGFLLGIVAVVISLQSRRNFKQAATKYNEARARFEQEQFGTRYKGG